MQPSNYKIPEFSPNAQTLSASYQNSSLHVTLSFTNPHVLNCPNQPPPDREAMIASEYPEP